MAAMLQSYPHVVVISDEIYEHINFTSRHHTIASMDGMKDRTVIINGMSKGYAMTGELTLTGHILAIGGVREKVIAAKRQGIRQLIVPDANRGEVDELNHPSIELADALRAAGYDGTSPIVASDHMLAGMLRVRFPDALVDACAPGED